MVYMAEENFSLTQSSLWLCKPNIKLKIDFLLTCITDMTTEFDLKMENHSISPFIAL